MANISNKNMQIDLELFRKTCIDVMLEVRDNKYNLKGKKACPLHWLQLPYQKIAIKYFPYQIATHNRVLFPASIIQLIAKEMKIYVTDIIRY